MTDAPDARTGAHLEPDALADLDEGLLDTGAEATARAHLAGCARCRDDLAALTRVRELLAGAAPVDPVPDDVAARLDRALAAEATGTDGATGTEADEIGTVLPLHQVRSGPRGMRVLQAAAVVVLLLAGGALGISALRGTSDSSGGASTASSGSAAADQGAPRAAEGGFPVTVSGRDWDETTLAAAAPQLAAGTFGPAVGSTLRSAASPGPTASGDADAQASGSGSAKALVDAPAGRLSGGRALADCVAGLTGGGVTPVAVDLATFKGEPAAVILLPPLSGDSTKVDVWVVGADCAPGETLYYASVPRS